MYIFMAIVGVFGFEGIRIYKRSLAGVDPIPKWRSAYFVGCVMVSGFAGVVAWAAELDSALKAIFLGFSIPANCKAVFSSELKGLKSTEIESETSDNVDDISPNSAGAVDEFQTGMTNYFKWFWSV
jgi:hypothetical protein